VSLKWPMTQYLVTMELGMCMPNKFRRFVVRVSGRLVVSDADNDFGRVVTPANVDVSVYPSARIEETKLEHLDPQQRLQLL